ncbi:hypothetical protein B7494_g3568 [Chlorociboria aeruginascens]|nr:hypothetical protein B7494_g3568 [Chlorociboria aeruginascens]
MASGNLEFDSFHDIDWKQQEEADENALQSVLSTNPGEASAHEGLFDVNRPLEAGEKADDAEDFEDISDDDLPEEEDATGPSGGDAPGLTDDYGTSHDTDDLFGDGRASSPFEGLDNHEDFLHHSEPHSRDNEGDLSFPSQEPEVDLYDINFPEDRHYGTNQDPSIPAPAESEEDFLKQSWPRFQKGVVLNWNELLPTKNAHYIPKIPTKPPKPLNPTKVSLDLAPDQEKAFRSNVGSATTDKRKRAFEAEAKGLVAILEESEDEVSGEDDFDWSIPSEEELIGGSTWADIQMACMDWESVIEAEPPKEDLVDDEPVDEWEQEILGHPAKRRKLTHEIDVINMPRYDVPSFDNYEEDLKRIAKRVVLDLNDPYLLVDIREPTNVAKRKIVGGHLKRSGQGAFSTLSQRFNISNDEAYDALKENHQSKVRAALGNLTVEHSMPALKLQWPYYRVKLYIKEARSFHRPSLKFNKFIGQNISFSKPGLRKKKNFKGMGTQDIFKDSKDLSLADHYSTATLLEYSEEHPTVLSNFGMGNRIINYYRRKDADDMDRPQPEDKIGDMTVLLPEDKSPFAKFGSVDPGETTRAIHNAMYRAPIFKHDSRATDFLAIRSSTGVGGTSWHLRNIDHVFAVGQQLPSVEVPGPHSRRVTNAAKNRMKMISYRKLRHNPHQTLKIGEVTAHIAESTDMQNRQKLKEFMLYDKVGKVWGMKTGEAVPEEANIRSMVKPEEVCLIDAMQVGSRHLEDAGYAAEDNDGDEPAESVEQDLAPWKTSKAFLDASTDKAMLQLHGEGDPSGCGLALSMIRTSMKGGYIGALQGPSATSAAAIAAEKKANGGHTYNVRKQQELYTKAIREIWEKQKANLSDPIEHAENDLEREQADEDERMGIGETPRSMPTPAGFDDSASQFSIGNGQGRAMKIIRRHKNKFGQVEEITEIVKDPRVWREYQKRRHAIDAEAMNVYEAKPTGNADFDRQEAIRVKKELARLERNKERRHAREKQKGIFRPSVEPDAAGSPSATPAPSVENHPKPQGTTRKCANCGQAGHIKTNKKLCPMLNGTLKPEDSLPEIGGFGAITAPTFP